MTSDELARIIGAMIDRPWRFDAPEAPAGSVDIHCPTVTEDQEPVAEWVQECNGVRNASAIVALANHADAFLELVRACEALGTQASGCDAGRQQIANIRAAVRAVHAVGKEGRNA